MITSRVRRPMTPPATRESRAGKRARARDDERLNACYYALFLSYFLYSIYSLTKPLSIIESIFVFTFRVERNDDTQQGSRLSG